MFRNAAKTFEGELEIRVNHQYSEPAKAIETWQSNECLAEETPKNMWYIQAPDKIYRVNLDLTH